MIQTMGCGDCCHRVVDADELTRGGGPEGRLAAMQHAAPMLASEAGKWRAWSRRATGRAGPA